MARKTQRCPKCGGLTITERVEIVVSGRGGPPLPVSAQTAVCQRCGEKLFDPATLQQVEELRGILDRAPVSRAERRRRDRHIANNRLRLSDVPGEGASWDAVWEFAGTYWRGIPSKLEGWLKVGKYANASRTAFERNEPVSTSMALAPLRRILYFEFRRYCHYGVDPTGTDEVYVRGLVAAIRQRVETGKRD